jgi:hypothetical protein
MNAKFRVLYFMLEYVLGHYIPYSFYIKFLIIKNREIVTEFKWLQIPYI